MLQKCFYEYWKNSLNTGSPKTTQKFYGQLMRIDGFLMYLDCPKCYKIKITFSHGKIM